MVPLVPDIHRDKLRRTDINILIFNTKVTLNGAAGRNRTDMGVSPHDFESCASTNFTTAAENELFGL